MKTLHSKRHLIHFWGLLLVMAVLMIGTGIVMCYSFFTHEGTQKTTTAQKAALIFGIGFIISYIYVAWFIWEQAPSWVMDAEKLVYNGNEAFYWKDLERLDLTGKYYSSRLWKTGEGTRIIFKGNNELIIFDEMYQNSSLMKLFLEQMIPEKQSTIHRPVIPEIEVIIDDLVSYKGSVWRAFLFYALLVHAFGLPLIFTNPVNRVPFGFLIYAGLVFIFWRLAVHTLHNFSLSDEEFIIKNSLWPGYQKVILLRKVREVIYEIKGKGMHTLTLVREDFQKQSFIAEGLSEQEWLDLCEQLWQKGLKVRNECIRPGENQRKEAVE